MPKTVVIKRPATDEEIRTIRGFGRVRFFPATWDKRFATTLAESLARADENGTSFEISDAQSTHVLRIGHRFRRQIEPGKWGRDGKPVQASRAHA